MISRRQLFRSSAVAAAIPATSLWQQRLSAAGAADPTDEAFWATVRAEFPLDENLVFLNAANVCPASKPVVAKHFEFLKDFYANPSFENREKYVGLENTARESLASVLGAKASEVTLTRNTSEATNTIVRGLNLRAGDEVIITTHNHPSNNASWKVLAKRTGVSPPDYVRRVQLAIAAVASVPIDSSGARHTGWLGTAGDTFVSLVLAYGYPALALSLLLGYAASALFRRR